MARGRKSFPRVLTGYFPVFVVLEFRKSSDENVEMTNIDFVVLEFRKSSSSSVAPPVETEV